MVTCYCRSHHTGEHTGREYGQTQAVHFDAKGRTEDGVAFHFDMFHRNKTKCAFNGLFLRSLKEPKVIKMSCTKISLGDLN